MNEKEAIKFLQSRVNLIKNDYPVDQKGEIQKYYRSLKTAIRALEVIQMIDILIAFALGTLFGAFSILLWAACAGGKRK